MVMHQSQDHWQDMSDPIEFEVPDPRRLHLTIRCFEDAQEQLDMHLIDAKVYLQKHAGHKAALAVSN
jgi:hypothetical protein